MFDRARRHAVAVGHDDFEIGCRALRATGERDFNGRPESDFIMPGETDLDAIDRGIGATIGLSACARRYEDNCGDRKQIQYRGASWLLRVRTAANELAAAGAAGAVFLRLTASPDRRQRHWQSSPTRRARRHEFQQTSSSMRSAGTRVRESSPISSISHMNVPSIPRAASFSKYICRINCWKPASVAPGGAAATPRRIRIRRGDHSRLRCAHLFQ